MALDDVYYRKPWTPAGDAANQLSDAFGSLPGLAKEKEDADARKAETERNARPVTPWEKAAARLLAGHDPKAVAADTKAELAGQPAGVSGVVPMQASIMTKPGSPAVPPMQGGGRMGMGGMSQPGQAAVPPTMSNVPVNSLGASPGGTAPQMPQSYAATAPGPTQQFGGGMGGPGGGQATMGPSQPYSGDMSGMQRPPMQQGGMSGPSQPAINSDEMFKGMNHRDWGEYITALEKGKTANRDRDYLAEIAAKGAEADRVQKTRNSGNETVAETRARASVNGQNLRADSEEMNRRIKEKSLDEKTANDFANIQFKYANMKQSMDKLDKSLGAKDQLEGAKILAKHADAVLSDVARVDASLTGLAGGANIDMKAHAAEMRAEATEAMGKADKIIKEHDAAAKIKPPAPSTVHAEKASGTVGAPPPAASQYKVGQQVRQNGVVKTVKGFDAQGKVLLE